MNLHGMLFIQVKFMYRYPLVKITFIHKRMWLLRHNLELAVSPCIRDACPRVGGREVLQGHTKQIQNARTLSIENIVT
jgi:hypothetical protein